MREFFRKFSRIVADTVGSPWAFCLAVVAVITWGITGPFFGYSDTWQLVINTGTSVATFLIVFVIQNTQNRDSKAIHLKLDELLRSITKARTGMVDLQDLSDEQLDRLQEQFKRLRNKVLEKGDHAIHVIEDELQDVERRT